MIVCYCTVNVQSILWVSLQYRPLSVLIQGGSNMTGTAAACLHTNQSWSYMNHLVQCCTKVTQLTILQYEDTIPLNDTVKVTSLIENVHMHEHVRAHAHVPSHTHTHTQTSPCPCNVST